MRYLNPDSEWAEADVTPADDQVLVATTRDELLMLAGAIGETLEAVEDREFQTRVGATPDEMRALRDRIGIVLRMTDKPE